MTSVGEKKTPSHVSPYPKKTQKYVYGPSYIKYMNEQGLQVVEDDVTYAPMASTPPSKKKLVAIVTPDHRRSKRKHWVYRGISSSAIPAPPLTLTGADKLLSNSITKLYLSPKYQLEKQEEDKKKAERKAKVTKKTTLTKRKSATRRTYAVVSRKPSTIDTVVSHSPPKKTVAPKPEKVLRTKVTMHGTTRYLTQIDQYEEEEDYESNHAHTRELIDEMKKMRAEVREHKRIQKERMMSTRIGRTILRIRKRREKFGGLSLVQYYKKNNISPYKNR